MAARDEVTAVYSQSGTRTRSRLVLLLRRLWRALTSYDDAAAEFVPAAASLVAGAQQAVAELTEEYTRATLSGYGVDVDRIPRVEPEHVSGAAVRNGADPVMYRRPFTEARRRIRRGEDVADVVAAGESRLVSLAESDVQLAKTRTAHRILNDPEVKRAGVRFTGVC